MSLRTDYLHESVDWHSYSAGEVLEKLATAEEGLSEFQSQQRLEAIGKNVLRKPKKRTALVRLLAQFNNLLLYVLMIAAVVTAFLEHWVDTVVIVAVVVINAIIGFIQEGKAEKALQAIQAMLSLQARVRRNKHFLSIPAEKLVPGDIVLIHSGDRIPADLRLFEVNSLQVQESILTGESKAIDKTVEKIGAKTEVADRKCMAYAGTLVTNGAAVGIVVATASRTQVGKVSSLLEGIQQLTTPLLRKINQFNRWLTLVIMLVSVATFAFGYLIADFTLDEIFLATVGFAVAAIPEGLPPVMTIVLALGVTKMAKHSAIIRRLPAVETLGSVTVICSDKTGTLTHNELMVQSVITAQDTITVTGHGYQPSGELLVGNKLVAPNQLDGLDLVAQAAILCNESELVLTNNQWELHGNPMDGALLAFGYKAKLDPNFERRSKPRTDLIPFESEHKFMATLHHDHAGRGYIFVKGAPEKIIAMCNAQYRSGQQEPIDSQYWLDKIETLATQAQRVLAIAYRMTDTSQTHLHFDDIQNGLVLIGLFGLIDPPRTEAIEAIAKCRNAGIIVKMITGDHATTAQAIAAQFGLGNSHQVVTGSELDKLTDEEFSAVANSAEVFARTTPEHKLRLVEALQSMGHIVGMTGDGVNDAPALKRADIGIAMGRKGTEASKEAADIVLADDNFASIIRAVEIGRNIYDNLRKTILMIVPTSGGEAMVVLLAILFAQVLPITPVQILWVNMITAVSLGLALAFESAEKNSMKQPPRSPGEPIFSYYFVWRLIFVSLIMVAGTFILFELEYLRTENLSIARTVAVNTIVFGEIFYLFNCRRITENIWTLKGIIGNQAVLVAVGLVIFFQILFTYVPLMQTLFGTSAIDIEAWYRVVLFGFILFMLVELEKLIVRRFNPAA